MGTKYSSQSISGYNSSPPADDGSATEANKTKWSTIKSKITDPIKTLAEAIDTALATAFDYSATAKTANYTTTADDHMKTIECNGTFTITLGAAASMAAGYITTIKNVGTGTVTVDGNASETIDGDLTQTLIEDDFITVAVDSGAGGWNIISSSKIPTTVPDATTFSSTVSFSKGADVASASALSLGTDGNCFDVTGTTTVTSIDTIGEGTVVRLQFDGALILTHHATDLILPEGKNITTAAGDIAEFYEYATGDWRCSNYFKESGLPPSLTQHGGEYIKLSDVKAQNTNGGTFTAGARRTRTLNTEDSDTGGHCTLSSNQFTLAAGTYRISASAPAYRVIEHQAYLYNVTDTADVIIGTTERSTSVDGISSSVVCGQFTISSSKAFEIQHECGTTFSNTGFGVPSNLDSEVYTVVELWKVR